MMGGMMTSDPRAEARWEVWRRIERDARAQCEAEVEAAESVPLSIGEEVVWSEHAQSGWTDGFSPVHRVAVLDGHGCHEPKTFCDEVVPAPKRRMVLSPRLVYVLP